MRRTFNLGVGLVAIVARESADRAIAALREAGEIAWRFGDVIPTPGAAFEDRAVLAG